MAGSTRLVAAMGLAVVLSGPVVLAQSDPPPLAEVARREAERRKGGAKAAKVYTNDDLRGGRPLTTAAAAKPPAKAATEQDADASAAKPSEAAKRAAELRESASRKQVEAQRLQKRVDDLNSGVLLTFDQVERDNLIKQRDALIGDFQKLQREIEEDSQAAEDLDRSAAKPATPPQD